MEKLTTFRFESTRLQTPLIGPVHYAVQQTRVFLCRTIAYFFGDLPVKSDLDIHNDMPASIFFVETAGIGEYSLLANWLQSKGRKSTIYIQDLIGEIEVKSGTPSKVLRLLSQGHDLVIPLQTRKRLLTGASQERHDIGLQSMMAQLAAVDSPPPLIPSYCLFSRVSEKYIDGFADRVFGSNLKPGYLRRFCQMLFNHKFVQLHLGKMLNPVELQRDTNNNAQTRIQINKAITTLRRVATGPIQTWKSRTIEKVIRDQRLLKTMKMLAKREGNTIEDQQQRARRILVEMAAEYSVAHAGFLNWCYQKIFRGCYEKLTIDKSGLERLRKVASKGHPLIIVPTHKSHMDYLICTGLLYSNAIKPPHIVAGVNLAFWPVGYFFRRSGAYFIRRSIGNDLLYARVLGAYIKQLLKQGHHQEIFIEGGRSRTGCILSAQAGILNITVDSYLEKACADLHYIPVSISYDKIVEDATYADELAGKPKAKESFWQVLKAIPKLRKKHGKAYIKFGKPLSLSDYAKTQTDKRTIVERLSNDITAEMLRTNSITPTALLTSVVMTSSRHAIEEKEAKEKCLWLYDMLEHKGAQLTCKKEDLNRELDYTINMLSNFELLTISSVENEQILQIPAGKRLVTNYYRNILAEALIGEACVATSMLTQSQVKNQNEVKEDFLLLRYLLQSAFVRFADKQISVDHWLENSWNNVTRSVDSSIDQQEVLKLLASLVKPYLETAWSVCVSLDKSATSIAETDVEQLQSQWQQQYLKGKLEFPESKSLVNIRNLKTQVTALATQDKAVELLVPPAALKEKLARLIASNLQQKPEKAVAQVVRLKKKN